MDKLKNSVFDLNKGPIPHAPGFSDVVLFPLMHSWLVGLVVGVMKEARTLAKIVIYSLAYQILQRLDMSLEIANNVIEFSMRRFVMKWCTPLNGSLFLIFAILNTRGFPLIKDCAKSKIVRVLI